MSTWKDFRITETGLKKGYNSDFFIKNADEIRRHHYNDGFDLHVQSYFENEDGTPHDARSYKTPYLRGISVGCSDPAQIEWFVEYWVKRGVLEPVNV